MILTTPRVPELTATDSKLARNFEIFQKLINELNSRSLPDATARKIDDEIRFLNTQPVNKSILQKSQAKIISLLEKELKIVPKKYYQGMWLALGMGAFGIPLGMAFGLAVGNIALLSIGIPIGLGLGIAIGTRLDNKAKTEGRQLNSELN